MNKIIDPVDIHVGKKIREARQAKNISQTKLGGALGITFQQVQKYEKGINRISASVLYHAAVALDVKPEYFFQGFHPVALDRPKAICISAPYDN